MHYGSTIV